MANHYLMKYKGRFRILPELNLDTGDFPRDEFGNIDETYDDLYISCQNGNKIKSAYLDESRRMLLSAYIPSLGRGRNVKKALDKEGIFYTNYEETDAEVLFLFRAKDIEPVAKLMKAKTSGANISPFSTKNLPKSNVEIPIEEIKRYKEITSVVQKGEFLLIHKITTSFLTNILEKKLKKKDKNFNYEIDMRKLKMSRQVKEYIYIKNLFEEYLVYLKNEIDKLYSK